MSILFLLTTLGTVATDLGHREESLRRKFKTEISNQFLTSFFFLAKITVKPGQAFPSLTN